MPVRGVYQVVFKACFKDALTGLGVDGGAADGDGCDGEAKNIALADFSILDIQLDNAKATGQIGILVVDINAVQGLVACDGLRVDVADVGNVAIGLHQVDVQGAIDSYQALGLLAPTDMGDMSVAESVYLVVGDDTLVVLVILIEVVGSQYEEVVTGNLYLLHVVVGQIVVPRANLSNA